MKNKSTANPTISNSIEADTLLALLTTSTTEEAANKLGIDRSTLWKRRKDFKIDEKIASIPQEALKRLQIHSIKAADTFGRNLNHRDAHIQNQSASEILDRVGIGKGPQVLVQNNNQISEVTFQLDPNLNE